MQGWISLHRELLDNPIVCKDTDYFSVWVYLLLQASHQDRKTIFNKNKIILKRGQLITGRKSIVDHFGGKNKINESKVQRILKLFESEQQIKQQTSNKNRLITILNYNKYQNNEQQNEQLVNNKKTTSEHRLNTNNKDNNLNKDNKVSNNYSLVAETWNDLGLCKVMKMTDQRKKHINARILDYGFDKFVGGIKSIKDSKFLMESKKTNWLNFDWVLNPNNFIKIVEGKYHKEFTNYSIKEKDLLPKDIESDWLDDYIKNIK